MIKKFLVGSMILMSIYTHNLEAMDYARFLVTTLLDPNATGSHRYPSSHNNSSSEHNLLQEDNRQTQEAHIEEQAVTAPSTPTPLVTLSRVPMGIFSPAKKPLESLNLHHVIWGPVPISIAPKESVEKNLSLISKDTINALLQEIKGYKRKKQKQRYNEIIQNRLYQDAQRNALWKNAREKAIRFREEPVSSELVQISDSRPEINSIFNQQKAFHDMLERKSQKAAVQLEQRVINLYKTITPKFAGDVRCDDSFRAEMQQSEIGKLFLDTRKMNHDIEKGWRERSNRAAQALIQDQEFLKQAHDILYPTAVIEIPYDQLYTNDNAYCDEIATMSKDIHIQKTYCPFSLFTFFAFLWGSRSTPPISVINTRAGIGYQAHYNQ